MNADFPASHYRDPGYAKRMSTASDNLLAALWREHPDILRRLTEERRG